MEDLKKRIISDWTAVNIYKIAYGASGEKWTSRKQRARQEERNLD